VGCMVCRLANMQVCQSVLEGCVIMLAARNSLFAKRQHTPSLTNKQHVSRLQNCVRCILIACCSDICLTTNTAMHEATCKFLRISWKMFDL
jgi:hypothetical protein